jgi:ABC-2 type transport system ATP-binding protein
VNAIETRALGKRYGRTWALQDCTLAIPGGRAVALVGPNGAGKSTLLHMAVGLSRPSTGAMCILGDLIPGSDAALAGAAFVAQDAPLYPNLTVADTVRLAANLNTTFDPADARDRLDQLDIPYKRKVGKLSGGQHAQVALAVALARHPRLLILDEPVARLDPLARHEFMAILMAAVADEGVSVVFSSHVVSELERVCDYLVVLSRGRVQVSGDVDSLLSGHLVVTGPAHQAAEVAANFPVVFEHHAGRQCRMLIRVGPHSGPPPGWDDAPTNLEELVLCYLRSPDVTALSGPVSAWDAA